MSEHLHRARLRFYGVAGRHGFMLLTRDAFGHMLTAGLSLRGMTARELARSLDVREATVSEWKNGRGLPTDDNLDRLIREMGWDERTGTRARQAVSAARKG